MKYTVQPVEDDFEVFYDDDGHAQLVMTFATERSAITICRLLNEAYRRGVESKRTVEEDHKKMMEEGFQRVSHEDPIYRELRVMLPDEEEFFMSFMWDEHPVPNHHIGVMVRETHYLDRFKHTILVRENPEYKELLIKYS